MLKKIIALVLVIFTLFLCGCKKPVNNPQNNDPTNTPTDGPANNQGSNEITNDESSYGDDLKDMGAYDGMFEGDLRDIKVTCVSGTTGAYKMEGNVLVFTTIDCDSVYSISGNLSGSIKIDVGDDYNFELEFCGFSLVSSTVNPVTVISGDEVTLQAKKDTENFIYDTRDAIPETDIEAISSAIHSDVDLEISGKGKLFVVSENNNGIHSKKDLQVKNLNLTVSCKDNALKGNDSVELENATAKLIATKGDCIKTTKSDISEKGNQRGTVSFNGGFYEIFAACDGIDAAYDVVVNDDNTAISIYTDKYSNYSEDVVSVSNEVYYFRFSSNNYKYSVKYYNSDDDYEWVNAEYHSTISGGRSQYYYHSFPKKDGYSKIKFFIYTSTMEQGQDSEYVACSDYITPNSGYDTIALSSRNGSITYDWTNYGIVSSGGPAGPGGFPGGPGMEGNSDKGDHSTKGIKACNEIIVYAGSISIKSYDDAIHAKNDEALENGVAAKGNVTVNGGSISIFTNDDGIHADGNITVNGGVVDIINSYEGMEAYIFSLVSGSVSVVSKDDGINGTASSGAAIKVSGGTLYVYAGGDGIDSNSRTSYNGISFSGGNTLVISTSNGNSAIDSEQGYSYTGGSVVAIMPRGAMTSEASKCQNFSSIGKSGTISLNKGDLLVCQIGSSKLTVKMPVAISSTIVILGSNSASASISSSSVTLNEGEFIWE